MCDGEFYNCSASPVINAPGHIVPFTSFGRGGRRRTPGEPLIFLSAPSLLSSARNTAPCFSWQNSEGRPCVPPQTSQRAHFSHFLRHAPASPRLGQAAGGRDRFFLSLSSPFLPPTSIIHSPSIQIILSAAVLALLGRQECSQPGAGVRGAGDAAVWRGKGCRNYKRHLPCRREGKTDLALTWAELYRCSAGSIGDYYYEI